MTEQEQRTLLELAAKAAEYDVIYEAEYLTFFRRDVQGRPIWNPLTDDENALQLAVKLKLCLGSNLDGDRAVVYGDNGKTITEEFLSNPYAATRLAIVRAAAKIGEKMEVKS